MKSRPQRILALLLSASLIADPSLAWPSSSVVRESPAVFTAQALVAPLTGAFTHPGRPGPDSRLRYQAGRLKPAGRPHRTRRLTSQNTYRDWSIGFRWLEARGLWRHTEQTHPGTRLTATEERMVRLGISWWYEWFLNPVTFFRAHARLRPSWTAMESWRAFWITGITVGAAITLSQLASGSDLPITLGRFVGLKMATHLLANVLNEWSPWRAALTRDKEVSTPANPPAASAKARFLKILETVDRRYGDALTRPIRSQMATVSEDDLLAALLFTETEKPFLDELASTLEIADEIDRFDPLALETVLGIQFDAFAKELDQAPALRQQFLKGFQTEDFEFLLDDSISRSSLFTYYIQQAWTTLRNAYRNREIDAATFSELIAEFRTELLPTRADSNRFIAYLRSGENSEDPIQEWIQICWSAVSVVTGLPKEMAVVVPSDKRLVWAALNAELRPRVSGEFFRTTTSDGRIKPLIIICALPGDLAMAKVVAHEAAHAIQSGTHDEALRAELGRILEEGSQVDYETSLVEAMMMQDSRIADRLALAVTVPALVQLLSSKQRRRKNYLAHTLRVYFSRSAYRAYYAEQRAVQTLIALLDTKKPGLGTAVIEAARNGDSTPLRDALGENRFNSLVAVANSGLLKHFGERNVSHLIHRILVYRLMFTLLGDPRGKSKWTKERGERAVNFIRWAVAPGFMEDPAFLRSTFPEISKLKASEIDAESERLFVLLLRIGQDYLDGRIETEDMEHQVRSLLRPHQATDSPVDVLADEATPTTAADPNVWTPDEELLKRGDQVIPIFGFEDMEIHLVGTRDDQYVDADSTDRLRVGTLDSSPEGRGPQPLWVARGYFENHRTGALRAIRQTHEALHRWWNQLEVLRAEGKIRNSQDPASTLPTFKQWMQKNPARFKSLDQKIQQRAKKAIEESPELALPGERKYRKSTSADDLIDLAFDYAGSHALRHYPSAYGPLGAYYLLLALDYAGFSYGVYDDSPLLAGAVAVAGAANERLGREIYARPFLPATAFFEALRLRERKSVEPNDPGYSGDEGLRRIHQALAGKYGTKVTLEKLRQTFAVVPMLLGVFVLLAITASSASAQAPTSGSLAAFAVAPILSGIAVLGITIFWVGRVKYKEQMTVEEMDARAHRWYRTLVMLRGMFEEMFMTGFLFNWAMVEASKEGASAPWAMFRIFVVTRLITGLLFHLKAITFNQWGRPVAATRRAMALHVGAINFELAALAMLVYSLVGYHAVASGVAATVVTMVAHGLYNRYVPPGWTIASIIRKAEILRSGKVRLRPQLRRLLAAA